MFSNMDKNDEYVRVRKQDLEFLQSQLERESKEKKTLIGLLEKELRQHEKDVETFRKLGFRILNGIIFIIVTYLIGYWIQCIFYH